MNRTELNRRDVNAPNERESIEKDILAKARVFCEEESTVRLVTRPSMHYPSGRKLTGFIFKVSGRMIVFADTFRNAVRPERIDIMVSEILSPADLFLMPVTSPGELHDNQKNT